MSKKRHQSKQTRSPSSQKLLRMWLIIGGALILIGGGLGIVWLSADTPSAAVPLTTGGPRLAVDQTEINEGYVKLDIPVRTTFRLKNVGGQPLHILGQPAVELIEGC